MIYNTAYNVKQESLLQTLLEDSDQSSYNYIDKNELEVPPTNNYEDVDPYDVLRHD